MSDNIEVKNVESSKTSIKNILYSFTSNTGSTLRAEGKEEEKEAGAGAGAAEGKEALVAAGAEEAFS